MFYIVIISILLLYLGINYYIGLWFWLHIGVMMPFLNVQVYWSVFSIIFIMSLVGLMWNQHLPIFLQKSFYFLASYWLAAVTYFTIFIVLIDSIYMIDTWMHFIPLYIKHNTNSPLIIGLLVFIIVMILLIYGAVNAKKLKVTSYNIKISKQAGSLKKLHIAFLSDIHLSDMKDKGMNKLIDRINQIEPDIVLIAGDIIDANRDVVDYDFLHMENNFQNVKSKYGIYASLGNHDYDHNGDSSCRINNFKQVGVNILRDSSSKIDESFYLIGREDNFYERISGIKRKELSELMEGMDRELPILVLDHQPSKLEEPRKEGIDLQLSGHTHKGQFFPFNLITKKVFKNDYGYLKIDNFQLIVSSGARTWGPPIRVGSKSEVVNIIIQFE